MTPAPRLLPDVIRTRTHTGALTIISRSGRRRITYEEIHEQAAALARGLLDAGVGPGSIVASVATTSVGFVAGALGSLYAGAGLLLLHPPKVGQPREAWAEAARGQIEWTGAVLLAQATDPEISGISDLKIDELPDHGTARLPEIDPSTTCQLSFSSGTTGEPKVIVRSHRVSVIHWETHRDCRGGFDPDTDVRVGWAPLGGWGLFGDILHPMAAGVDSVMLTPATFSADPLSWIRALSESRGTCSVVSASAYGLVTKALHATSENFDLSRWRIAGITHERTDASVIDAFATAAARHGFDRRAFKPAYGNTEGGALAATPLDEGPLLDHVSARSLADGVAEPLSEGVIGVTTLVSVGAPLPWVDLRVVDDADRPVPDRHIGEVQARGDGLMDGYLNDEEATAASFTGEWFRTGDLGYLAEGRLYITGRIKNVIIIRGRNYLSEDIEATAQAALDDPRATCAAIGIRSAKGEDLVVVIETSLEGQFRDDARERVSRATFARFGIAPREVVMQAPGSLPRTSSNKIQRHLIREKYVIERGL